MAKEYRLSKRELDVIEYLLQGKSNKLIAAALGISVRTVEFHLNNIYTKYHVGSRIELVLKLRDTTGIDGIGKPGYSTVENPDENAENRDWIKSLTNTFPKNGKESEMRQSLITKHVLVGVITAFMTGFLWLAMFQRVGHMSPDAIAPWILPLVIILAIIGLSVGLVGRLNGNKLIKVFFGALFGTGLGAFAMIPLMGFVIYPLAKLAERLGLINRSAISTDVTSNLVILAMIVLWLVVGIVLGIIPLFVLPGRPVQGPGTGKLYRPI
jgi:DNA-binding CsgD family transcriptional regulator